MRIFYLLLASLFLTCLPVQAEEAAPLPEPISAKEMKKLLEGENAILVDVRTDGEFQAGHLPKAKNINFFGPRFETEILKLPKDAPIILYCKSGRRSEAAGEFLLREGYSKVFSLKNGIEAWKKDGGKLEKESGG